MVRAATLGVIDFSRFDPVSAWWWKRFYMVMNELSAQQHRETNAAVHMHWVTLASHSRLTPESFDATEQRAADALQTLLGSYYPWLDDKFKKSDLQEDPAVKAFREQYGYPGDPRYEKMLAEAKHALRKQSPFEKEAARRKRRAKARTEASR